ncbi:MAG: hypothetical protein U0Q22_09555 [Acidimicrobiales bacterium]
MGGRFVTLAATRLAALVAAPLLALVGVAEVLTEEPVVATAPVLAAIVVVWRLLVCGVRIDDDRVSVTNIIGGTTIARDDVVGIAVEPIHRNSRNTCLVFLTADGDVRAPCVSGGRYSASSAAEPLSPLHYSAVVWAITSALGFDRVKRRR